MAAASPWTICAGKILIAAALSAGGLAPTAANASTTGQCSPGKAKFVIDNEARSRSSTAFANISGTAVTFTQGGDEDSCVIVYFSAEVATEASATMFLRATIDDVAHAVPGQKRFIYDTVNYQTHATSFIFPSVSPGSHTIRLQYSSDSNSHSVFVRQRDTIVHFAP